MPILIATLGNLSAMADGYQFLADTIGVNN
jgi:hypothetical protein